MKILHVMAGLGEASGVANIARRFARTQRERGDAAVLLAPAVKWNPIYFGLLFAIKVLWHALSADEIWVHCSWTFPVWYGAWLAKRTGKKLVVVPEASFDPKRINNHAGWKKRLVMPLDKAVIRRADEVLALCKDEIEWVKAFEPAARVRLARVPTFYERVPIRRVTGELLRKEGRLYHVLFLGRAEDPLKGVQYLKQAVEKLPVELHVVSNKFGEELEKEWAWADVLCLPTLSENFGLVVAEALERGKPVITTDGAPAWHDLKPTQGCYLKGYRQGTDATRIRLLKDALIEFLG